MLHVQVFQDLQIFPYFLVIIVIYFRDSDDLVNQEDYEAKTIPFLKEK